MLEKDLSPQIFELESKLDQAYLQNDRKQIKRLLNGVWWQFKGDLKEASVDSVVKLMELLSKYKEFGNREQIEKFREKISYRISRVDDGRPKDPNRIVETLSSGSMKMVNGELRFVWRSTMVHRANGRVEEIKREAK